MSWKSIPPSVHATCSNTAMNAREEAIIRRQPTKANSVTGRDAYIIRQALGHAIVAIERLPQERQDPSNRHDMIRLLCADVGTRTAGFYVAEARLKHAHAPSERGWIDLWKDEIARAYADIRLAMEDDGAGALVG